MRQALEAIRAHNEAQAQGRPYLVRVEGDRMIGAGIFPGDLVVIDRSIEDEPGHIVIAAVNCEPLCKHLARDGMRDLHSDTARWS